MDYTPEQQAAAWAAYYAQQGYEVPAAYGQAGPQNLSYDPEVAAQQSAYMPADMQGPSSSHQGGGGSGAGPSQWQTTGGGVQGDGKREKKVAQGKRTTVIRKAGGKVWEDQTLVDWEPSWFRLFVGDLSNDVSENTLNKAFDKYKSYCKCKVVRDRLSMKAKYGFIAFSDPEDMLKAWKEMDGIYVGNRPIRLMKVQSQYGGTNAVNVGARKAKELDKIAQNKGKPLNGRPTPW